MEGILADFSFLSLFIRGSIFLCSSQSCTRLFPPLSDFFFSSPHVVLGCLPAYFPSPVRHVSVPPLMVPTLNVRQLHLPLCLPSPPPCPSHVPPVIPPISPRRRTRPLYVNFSKRTLYRSPPHHFLRSNFFLYSPSLMLCRPRPDLSFSVHGEVQPPVICNPRKRVLLYIARTAFCPLLPQNETPPHTPATVPHPLSHPHRCFLVLPDEQADPHPYAIPPRSRFLSS